MKHQSTRTVFDYWNAKRGTRAGPARAEIDPAEIRHALSDTFTLAADFTDQLRFRLAGTRGCALFNREIKGEAFTALWSEPNSQSIDDLLAIVIQEATGAVAGLTARTEDGAETDLAFAAAARPCRPHPASARSACWRRRIAPDRIRRQAGGGTHAWRTAPRRTRHGQPVCTASRPRGRR